MKRTAKVELNKYQLKVKNQQKSYDWVHFCYVPIKIKNAFDKHINNRGWLNNQWVSRWAKSDFGLGKIDKPEDLAELKKAIRNSFKEQYPDIYLESDNDNQGWLRVWIVQNMRRELKEIGKEC